jgi:hypothetical protein
MGYFDGRKGSFAFRIDSTKIFFALQKVDAVKYGIVPDSVARVINAIVSTAMSDSRLRSKDNLCQDCSILVLHVIRDKDTLSIKQVGNIDGVFWPIIRTLRYFIDSVPHPTIQVTLFDDLRKLIFLPPPPASLKDKSFTPPK